MAPFISRPSAPSKKSYDEVKGFVFSTDRSSHEPEPKKKRLVKESELLLAPP